jgi:Ca2+:H+ antiporter
MSKLNWLLLFIPVSIALRRFGADPILIFAASALALIPLAGLTEDATDALASYLGQTWGGLLSASLGNAPEIIIGFFALREGLVDIVKASLIGSILGNLLLTLGLSMFVGGVRHGIQRFNEQVAGMNGALLMMTATALIIPAVFRFTSQDDTREISLEISVILFLAYIASLVYTIVTSKPIIGKEAVRVEKKEPIEPLGGEKGWSRNKALFILLAVTIGLAVMSEILTDAIEPASRKMGLTPLFAGVFLLATVGNVAQLFNAVSFARSNKMDLSLGVTVGSSIQVALVVTPVLVFSSYFLGQEKMNLLFSHFEIVAVILAVIVTRELIFDGRSNWLEGIMLIAVYLMLGFGFYYLPPNPPRL